MAEIEHVHTFIETSRESEVLTSFAANYPVLGRFLGVIVHSTCDCGAVTSEWHSEAIVEAAASTEERFIISKAQLATIGAALSDAGSFYEMFDGWEGVPEREVLLEQASDVWNAVVAQGGVSEPGT